MTPTLQSVQTGRLPAAAAAARRTRHRRLPAWTVPVILGLVAVIGILLGTDAYGRRQDEAATSAGQAQALAPAVLARCDQLTTDERQTRADCAIAAQVAAQPAAAEITAGLDRDQVLALIQTELDKRPTPPGKAPTVEDITAAARTVLTANPDLFRGAAAPAPTDEQLTPIVAAAVAAYSAAHPPTDGAPGRDGINGLDGIPGRGVVSSEPDPDDPCFRVVRYSTPPLEERWGPFCTVVAPGTGSTPAGTTTDPPAQPGDTVSDAEPSDPPAPTADTLLGGLFGGS